MRNVRRILALLVLFSLFVGAMLGVLEAASRAGPLAMPIPSVIDASPPDETAKLVFVHASVGEQWLGHWLGGQQGGAYWSISLGGNNYNVRDYNIHNNDTLHDIDIDHNYCDWYHVFTNPTNLDMLFNHNLVEGNYDALDAGDAGENDIVMIKPCFIQYPIVGNPDDPPSGESGCPGDPDWGWNPVTVGNVKQVLIDIRAVFAQHPDKFFVLVTAPPKKEDGMTYGENARAIADWMVHEWLADYTVGNVMVFNLYNVLTSNALGQGDPCQHWDTYPHDPESASDVGLATGNHHRVWQGGLQHQVGYDQTYSAYCSSHPGKGATYKMTREFVPLLNVYYNAWVSGDVPASPTNTPTPVPLPMGGKSVHPGSGDYGDLLTYTISLEGTGQTITVTDPIPAGLAYVPDSAGVSPAIGTLTVDGGPVLRWSGAPADGAMVEITFGAHVTEPSPAGILNTASIDYRTGTSEWSATVIVNGQEVYLPLVMR